MESKHLNVNVNKPIGKRENGTRILNKVTNVRSLEIFERERCEMGCKIIVKFLVIFFQFASNIRCTLPHCAYHYHTAALFG